MITGQCPLTASITVTMLDLCTNSTNCSLLYVICKWSVPPTIITKERATEQGTGGVLHEHSPSLATPTPMNSVYTVCSLDWGPLWTGYPFASFAEVWLSYTLPTFFWDVNKIHLCAYPKYMHTNLNSVWSPVGNEACILLFYPILYVEKLTWAMPPLQKRFVYFGFKKLIFSNSWILFFNTKTVLVSQEDQIGKTYMYNKIFYTN